MKARKIPSAQSHVPALKHIVHGAYDARHRLTLPKEKTADLLVWGYAIDKQHWVMAWLGSAYSTADPFAPEIRHWKSGTKTHTLPLPGMHFFDAWKIRPGLQLDPLLGVQLASLGTDELIPQEAPNTDYDKGIEQMSSTAGSKREVRRAAKTTAQKALEIAHVHRLAKLVSENSDLLKELAIQRKSYQEEVKEKGQIPSRRFAF